MGNPGKNKKSTIGSGLKSKLLVIGTRKVRIMQLTFSLNSFQAPCKNTFLAFLQYNPPFADSYNFNPGFNIDTSLESSKNAKHLKPKHLYATYARANTLRDTRCARCLLLFNMKSRDINLVFYGVLLNIWNYKSRFDSF